MADTNPATWADALGSLVDDPARRAALGRFARATIETAHIDWASVLVEDLMPVWRARRGSR